MELQEKGKKAPKIKRYMKKILHKHLGCISVDSVFQFSEL